MQDETSFVEATHGFRGAVRSELINCGTYGSLPLFVIRHYQGTHAVLGPQYCYSVQILT